MHALTRTFAEALTSEAVQYMAHEPQTAHCVHCDAREEDFAAADLKHKPECVVLIAQRYLEELEKHQ